MGRLTFALALASLRTCLGVLDAAEQHRLTRLTARPTWAALSPSVRCGTGAWWRSPSPPPAAVTSPLRLDERIANYLMGIDYLDDRIAPLCQRQLFAAGRDVQAPDAAIARGHRTARSSWAQSTGPARG